MDFDGAAGAAALMLSIIGNYYTFPSKETKLDDSAIAVNVAIIIGVVILVTKFFYALFFNEFGKAFVEGVHQIMCVIALGYLGKAYLLMSNDLEGMDLLKVVNSAPMFTVLFIVIPRLTLRCKGLQEFFGRMLADYPMAAAVSFICMAIGVYLVTFDDVILGLIFIFFPILVSIFMYAATVLFNSGSSFHRQR